MNIKPLADRVLVLPAPAEEKVGGSLSQIQQRKNHSVVKSLLQVRERRMKR